MNRRERRLQDAEVQKRKQEHLGSILGDVVNTGGYNNKGEPGAGGFGVPLPGAKPATGQKPSANPFIIPKPAGLNITSQTFPSNYYVNWDLSTWRSVCDMAIKMGYTVGIAALYNWVFECSPFIQSLFRALSVGLGKIPFYYVDEKGDRIDEWTDELCNKPWQIQMRKEILFSFFWGFTVLNFDPNRGAVYKYPMQDVDPINRMLRSSTFAFYDGINTEENDNLLFIQPSTSYESFLGWMQPIARAFIQMNMNKNNWVAAGRRLAFPILTVGYPQNDSMMVPDPNNPDNLISVNQFREQAEAIGSNIDPSKAIVYPYTLNEKNEIQKAIVIESEGKGASNRAHSIFSDFNESEKNEIREMILGGTLTADVGNSGSRALGEVQERKFDSVLADNVEFVIAYLNESYLPKISKFYKNMPKGRFEINRAKQMTIEDIEKLSNVVVANGKRLTEDFFEANGLVKNFFEDAPEPAAGVPNAPPKKFSAVMPEIKKKYW